MNKGILITLLFATFVAIILLSCMDEQTNSFNEYDKIDKITPVGFWGDLWDCVVVVAADATGAIAGSSLGTPGMIVGGVAASIKAADEKWGADSSVISSPPSPHNTSSNEIDSTGYAHNEVVLELFNNQQSLYLNTDGTLNYDYVFNYTTDYMYNNSIDTNGISDGHDDLESTFNNLDDADDITDHISIVQSLNISQSARDYFSSMLEDIENADDVPNIISIISGYQNGVDTLNITTVEKYNLKCSFAVGEYSAAIWYTLNAE